MNMFPNTFAKTDNCEKAAEFFYLLIQRIVLVFELTATAKQYLISDNLQQPNNHS